jgi:hypothetical protein
VSLFRRFRYLDETATAAASRQKSSGGEHQIAPARDGIGRSLDAAAVGGHSAGYSTRRV